MWMSKAVDPFSRHATVTNTCTISICSLSNRLSNSLFSTKFWDISPFPTLNRKTEKWKQKTEENGIGKNKNSAFLFESFSGMTQLAKETVGWELCVHHYATSAVITPGQISSLTWYEVNNLRTFQIIRLLYLLSQWLQTNIQNGGIQNHAMVLLLSADVRRGVVSKKPSGTEHPLNFLPCVVSLLKPSN